MGKSESKKLLDSLFGHFCRVEAWARFECGLKDS
jgi:hypothetical protein